MRCTLPHAATAAPDAKLIAASNKYFEVNRLLAEKYGDDDIEDDDPLMTQLNEALQAVKNLQAVTLDGCRARARVIVDCKPGIMSSDRTGLGESIHDAMIAMLLRDLGAAP